MKTILNYLKLIYAAMQFVRYPEKLDEVLAIAGAVNNKVEVDAIVEHLKSQPRVARAFQTRPGVGEVNVRALAALPDGTVGKAYADYLSVHGFGTKDIYVNHSSSNLGPDGDYAMSYFYDTHDLYHVVTGFETDLAGELGLQAYYATKGPTRFPTFILALGLLNTVLFQPEDKFRRMEAIARGWHMGMNSENLFGIDWKSSWERPLAELRQEFRVEPVAVNSGRPCLNGTAS